MNVYEQLVKLGAERPELRAHIRPLLKAAKAGDTFAKRLSELQKEYLKEVLDEAQDILKNEGAKDVKVKDNRISGVYQDQEFSVEFGFRPSNPAAMFSQVTYSGVKKAEEFVILSLSPMNVASEAMYAHHRQGGFLL